MTRRVIGIGAGIGMIAAGALAALGSVGPALVGRLPAPPPARPKLSANKVRRRQRAARMLVLADKPVQLKHMHAAARRRSQQESATVLEAKGG